MLCATLPLPLFDTTRLGVIMEPRPGDPHEVEGVLNPAGVVGPDGEYYLFPRLVGAHNYSRVGTARVIRDGDGRPVDVERLPHALEPAAPYEIVRPGIGGCEDPRVTYVAALELYVLAYTALGPTGPHVALASSRNLRRWRRHGLVDFATEDGINFSRYSNKDAILLPEPVKAPDGRRAYALLHRPMYESWPGEDGIDNVPMRLPRGVHDDRPSIWISYCPLGEADWSGETLLRFGQHHLLATPESAWEAYRIGGGTVPVRIPDGLLTFYHGVELYTNGGRCYRAGAMVLDADDPRRVLSRSETPIFGPETEDERVGMVGNVVFPTAAQRRDGGVDVYYGMADSRIGVAHLKARSFTID